MKAFILTGILGLLSVGAVQMARADVDSLSIKFGGGCVSTSTGTCTLRVTAAGTDLGSETIRIQHADSSTGTFTKLSSRTHALSDSGRATIRIANASGCYRAVTGPNGNDKPDRKSRAVCE